MGSAHVQQRAVPRLRVALAELLRADFFTEVDALEHGVHWFESEGQYMEMDEKDEEMKDDGMMIRERRMCSTYSPSFPCPGLLSFVQPSATYACAAPISCGGPWHRPGAESDLAVVTLMLVEDLQRHCTFQKIFTIIRIFLKSEAPKALYSFQIR